MKIKKQNTRKDYFRKIGRASGRIMVLLTEDVPSMAGEDNFNKLQMKVHELASYISSESEQRYGK